MKYKIDCGVLSNIVADFILLMTMIIFFEQSINFDHSISEALIASIAILTFKYIDKDVKLIKRVKKRD